MEVWYPHHVVNPFTTATKAPTTVSRGTRPIAEPAMSPVVAPPATREFVLLTKDLYPVSPDFFLLLVKRETGHG
jgi:hypothetical protein